MCNSVREDLWAHIDPLHINSRKRLAKGLETPDSQAAFCIRGPSSEQSRKEEARLGKATTNPESQITLQEVALRQ